MNVLDNRAELEHFKLVNGLNPDKAVSKVSSYIIVQKIKAKIRESQKYLYDEIYFRFKRDGIETINRFNNYLERVSDEEVVKIEQQIENSTLLETIILNLRLDKTKVKHKEIKIPKIFESIEVDGQKITSLDELLKLIEAKQTVLYAPSVSRESRKRDIMSFGYDSNRHTDKEFTLIRFLTLRGYKDLLMQKHLYP